MIEVLELPRGRRLALGLAWKPLFHGPHLAAEIAALEARGNRIVCRAERSGIVAAGVLDAADPRAADITAAGGQGWHSGALCAARFPQRIAKSDAGVLVVRLDAGGYWVGAVRDGLPLPGGDLVLGDENAVAFHLAGFGDDLQGAVFFSEGCEGIGESLGSHPRSFARADWLRQAGGETAFLSDRPDRRPWIAGGLALLALTGIGAWYFRPEPPPPPRPLRPTKSPEELAAIRERARAEAVRKALDANLAGPSLVPGARACLARIGAVPWWVGLEPLSAASCDGRSLTAVYHRERGSPTPIQAFHRAYGDTGLPDPAARSATLTRPLPNPPPALAGTVTETSRLPATAMVYDRLLTLGQAIEGPLLGLAWTLTPPAPVAIPYLGPDTYGDLKQPETVPPEQGFSVGRLQVQFPGMALVPDVLGRLGALEPSLVFQGLTATPAAARGFDFTYDLELTYVVH